MWWPKHCKACSDRNFSAAWKPTHAHVYSPCWWPLTFSWPVTSASSRVTLPPRLNSEDCITIMVHCVSELVMRGGWFGPRSLDSEMEWWRSLQYNMIKTLLRFPQLERGRITASLFERSYSYTLHEITTPLDICLLNEAVERRTREFQELQSTADSIMHARVAATQNALSQIFRRALCTTRPKSSCCRILAPLQRALTDGGQCVLLLLPRCM